jgi:PAS domain S-box-containing protein
MPKRVSNVSHLLRSPTRILAIVLALVFTVEAAVMLVLPLVFPDSLGDSLTAILDALLLTSLCAPVLWWVIIGPLRRLAIQEHQRSETIVAGASEGILTFDRAGEVVSCNQAGGAILGSPAESLIGQPIRQVIPGFPRSFASLPDEFRLEAVRQDGTKTPVQVSVSAYPLETDELFIAIIRDLTVAEQAERERITMARETEALRAQQMATLAQLATGVAHEIRNPLTSIKMLIQVNRSKFSDEGLPTDDLELVEQEIRRMERSVNSLLDYARPEKDEFREFPIQDAVRRTMQLIEGRCKTQSVELQVAVPDQAVMIFGDVAKLQQLLLNLCLNALDAMPHQGTLDLTVRCDGDEVELTLCDTGAGISEDVLDKLFTPFVTTKVSGVGLGLGICRHIAQSHQGRLTGTNRASGGAQFSLMLPLAGNRLPASTLSTDNEDASCNAY